MFEDDSLGESILKNPGSLQSKIIDVLQTRLGGELIYADPNNGFNALLEASVSTTAEAVTTFFSATNAQYPKRVTTSEELYNHMSDQDYLQMMAKPSSTKFSLRLGTKYLADNAVSYNDYYKKVIIPADTVFSIGSRNYGIYYPIEIRINKKTNNFVVVFDTTTENPLKTLTSNAIDTTTYTITGLEIIAIEFDAYQFTKSSDTNHVTSIQGFRKSYTFTDKYYACRVFTKIDDAWVELSTTLSEEVYDVTEATAKIKLYEDVNKIDVVIPQIYFSKGMIGNTVKVDLYTTEGAIVSNLTSVEASSTTARFSSQEDASNQYSTILNSIPTMALVPTESSLSGGSDGISFAELRKRVINNSVYNKVIISPPDIENYLSDSGFSMTKLLDNLTNRIYYAGRTLTGGANYNVPVSSTDIQISLTDVANISTIKVFEDNIVTLLPTTLYQYSESANICFPCSDEDITVLNNMTKEAFVEEVNSTRYTRTPLHTVTYTSSTYPYTKSFNLLSPSINGIRFVAENINIGSQMSATAAIIEHLNDGAGGYNIRISVKKSEDFAALDEDNILIVLATTDKSGRFVYAVGIRYGTLNDTYLYDFKIDTTYHISEDGYFRTELYYDLQNTVTCDLSLDSTFQLLFFTNKDAFPATGQDYDLIDTVPSFFSDLLIVSKQEIDITFGKDLYNGIYNITDSQWSSEQYMTYLETEYEYYDADEYETVDGKLVYQIVTDPDTGKQSVVLNKTHSAGDIKLDATTGEPIVKHYKGDYKRNTDGSLIVSKTRELIYYVEAPMFDARLYFSNNVNDVSYIKNLPTELNNYIDTVESISKDLIERTFMYFKPNRTMGTSSFSIGDGVITQTSLGLSFKVKFYVTEATYKSDDLKKLIKSTSTDIISAGIEDDIISFTDISTTIKDTLSEHVVSLDILGINGNVGLQTLIPQESDIKPMVALKLVIGADGQYALEKDIEYEFVVNV